MNTSFDPGALLAHSYQLPRGPRVCLRLARARDRAGIEHLLARQGLSVAPLELVDLLRSPPRGRLVLCATALVRTTEAVVGFGAIELAGEGPLEPSLIVVDHELTTGLDHLLADALRGRASALLRSRAA